MLPICPLASMFIERRGLRAGMLVGAIRCLIVPCALHACEHDVTRSLFFCGWVRYVASLSQGLYWLAFIGQVRQEASRVVAACALADGSPGSCSGACRRCSSGWCR
jgi:hypothetical protein